MRLLSHTFCCLHDRDSAGEATATQTLILLSYTQTQTNILLSYIHKDNTLFVVYTTATTTVKKITLITVVCSTLYIRGIYAQIFATPRRAELAVIPGLTGPPMFYHALVCELGPANPRFREFVQFHSGRIYPEYIMCYIRQ
jgi:hypothetical protein